MGYKLYYFEFRGVAEPIRLILNHVGAEFEDVRIPMSEWPSKKAGFTFGTLPVLEDDGQQLSQGMVIGLYLGVKHGDSLAVRITLDLVPKERWQRIKAMELVNAWVDMIPKFITLSAIEDKQKKKEKYEEIKKDFLLPRLKIYDDIIGKSKSGFLFDEICWADFFLYNWVKGVDAFWNVKVEDCGCKNLVAYVNKVEAVPSVKAWNEKHKDVKFSPASLDL